jgi:hypothetical protein
MRAVLPIILMSFLGILDRIKKIYIMLTQGKYMYIGAYILRKIHRLLKLKRKKDFFAEK